MGAGNGVEIGLSYRPDRLHRLAGRYENSVPTRFLIPIGCSKIPAQFFPSFYLVREFLSALFGPGKNHSISDKPTENHPLPASTSNTVRTKAICSLAQIRVIFLERCTRLIGDDIST
jgi:hypothetical protein